MTFEDTFVHGQIESCLSSLNTLKKKKKSHLIICTSLKTEQIIVSPDEARVQTLKSPEVLQNKPQGKTSFSHV